MSISYAQVIHRQISYPQGRDKLYTGTHKLCTGYTQAVYNVCISYAQVIHRDTHR
jgi:hypothetical protein